MIAEQAEKNGGQAGRNAANVVTETRPGGAEEGREKRRQIHGEQGKKALEKIKTAIPDLLMIDLKMPRMGGYELIGMLKENTETKDIPVLIMSGYAVEIDKLKEYVKRKAIPVVGKPVNIGQFKKLVNYLL